MVEPALWNRGWSLGHSARSERSGSVVARAWHWTRPWDSLVATATSEEQCRLVSRFTGSILKEPAPTRALGRLEDTCGRLSPHAANRELLPQDQNRKRFRDRLTPAAPSTPVRRGCGWRCELGTNHDDVIGLAVGGKRLGAGYCGHRLLHHVTALPVIAQHAGTTGPYKVLKT